MGLQSQESPIYEGMSIARRRGMVRRSLSHSGRGLWACIVKKCFKNIQKPFKWPKQKMEREEGNEKMQRLNRFGSRFGKALAETLFTTLLGGITGYSAYLLVGPGVHQALSQFLL
jgi:hypothetical protein